MTVVSEHPWGLGAGCKGTRRWARPPWGSEHTPKEVLLRSWTLAGAPHRDTERLSEKLLSASECGVCTYGVLSYPFSRLLLPNAL